jgi:hypothetical protein
MINGPDGQVALEIPEGLFDLSQLQIKGPQLGWIAGG